MDQPPSLVGPLDPGKEVTLPNIEERCNLGKFIYKHFFDSRNVSSKNSGVTIIHVNIFLNVKFYIFFFISSRLTHIMRRGQLRNVFMSIGRNLFLFCLRQTRRTEGCKIMKANNVLDATHTHMS